MLHDTATRPRHAPCRTRVSELFLAQNELVSTDTATPCPFDTRVRHGCEPCRLFWCRVRATLVCNGRSDTLDVPMYTCLALGYLATTPM